MPKKFSSWGLQNYDESDGEYSEDSAISGETRKTFKNFSKELLKKDSGYLEGKHFEHFGNKVKLQENAENYKKSLEKCNPNYYKGGSFKTNCYSCVLAFVLNQLGIKCESTEAQNNFWDRAFFQYKCYGMIDEKEEEPNTKDEINDKLLSSIYYNKTYSTSFSELKDKMIKEFKNDPVGTIYNLFVSWNPDTSHATCVIKLKDGFRFVDPQTNNDNYSERLLSGKVFVATRMNVNYIKRNKKKLAELGMIKYE